MGVPGRPKCAMKRIMFMCVTALLALVLCAPLLMAEAEQTTGIITYTMELSNNRFTRPEEVTVTIKATNVSDQDMPGPVTLYYPDGIMVEEFGNPTLAAGQSQTWTGTWQITENELQRGRLTFSLRWYEYDSAGEIGQRGVNFAKTIIYVEAEPSLEVNRYITPSMAREGQEVNVVYEVVNTGTVDITNVTIRENSDISKASGSILTVPAGERASYTFTVKMAKKDLTSSATITYRAGSNTGTITKEESVIKYGDVKLTATLKADKKGGVAGDTVKFTLTLKNTGSADYSNVSVSDAVLGEIFSGTSVPANKTVTLEKEITITGSQSYQFVISGQDVSGASIETATERVSIVEIDPSKAISLTVEASSDREVVYALPGVVRFKVKVTNNGQNDVENVSVSSAGGVTLYQFDVIKAGQTREFVRDASISLGGQFRFDATVKDELEETQTFNSNIVMIAYEMPTPVPTDIPIVTPPAPVYEEMPTRDDLPGYVSTVEKIISVLNHAFLILAGVCGALLLIGGVRRLQANHRAKDHLERSSARVYDMPAPKDKRARKEEPREESPAVPQPADENNAFEVPEVKISNDAAARDGALMEETLRQLYKRADREEEAPAEPSVVIEEADEPAEEEAPESGENVRRRRGDRNGEDA